MAPITPEQHPVVRSRCHGEGRCPMTVLTSDLRGSFAASVAAVNEARLLPPVIYTSQEFYEFERRSIFGHEWLCVGRGGPGPQPRRLPLHHHRRRAADPAAGLRWRRRRDVGGVPAPGHGADGGIRERAPVHLPVPPLVLRAGRLSAGGACDGAGRRIRQGRPRASSTPDRTVAGLRVLQSRSRCSAAWSLPGQDRRRCWRTSTCLPR